MISLLQNQLNLDQTSNPLGYLSSQLSDNQYKSFLYLLSKATRYRDFYYSQYRIAEELQCSVSSVKRWFGVLEDHNVIQVVNRGYLKTNIYVMHDFYKKNKVLFFSKYKNFLNKGLLTISKTALQLRELLLRNNVVINILDQRASFEEREKKMFQLSQDQVLECKNYPRWAYDRSLSIMKLKIESGLVIQNPANFFMSVLRGESAKRAPTAPQQQYRNTQKENKSGPYVRPATGPYSIYQPKEKVAPPSIFEVVMALEQEYHNNPSNSMRATVADMMLKNLTDEQQNDVWRSIHNETCRCRPDLVFGKREFVGPVEVSYEDSYADTQNSVFYE